jgi:hypothetical protein
MRLFPLLLLLTLALGACTPAPLTLSPALEAEIRDLVRTRCAPGVPAVSRPATTPTLPSTLWEVG